jgi:hypothetical protein
MWQTRMIDDWLSEYGGRHNKLVEFGEQAEQPVGFSAPSKEIKSRKGKGKKKKKNNKKKVKIKNDENEVEEVEEVAEPVPE